MVIYEVPFFRRNTNQYERTQQSCWLNIIVIATFLVFFFGKVRGEEKLGIYLLSLGLELFSSEVFSSFFVDYMMCLEII